MELHSATVKRAPWMAVLPLILISVLLTACGVDRPIDIPSPTGSITASVPTPTRSPSRSPSRGDSEAASESASPSVSEPASETPSESETPGPTETPTEPDEPDKSSEPPSEPSDQPSSNEPEASDSPSASPSEAEPEASDSAEQDELPSWFWWLLAGLGVLAAVLAATLIPRARRRKAWDAELVVVHDEVTWFAQELVPTLQQSASPDEVAGGWHFAAARVTRAEDQLTVLEASAPDETRRSEAQRLRDGVRTATQRMEDLLIVRDPMTVARDLASIETVLVTALKPVGPAAGPTHAS